MADGQYSTSVGSSSPAGDRPNSQSNSRPNSQSNGQPVTVWRMLHPAGLIVAMVSSVRGIIGLFITFLVILRRELSGTIIVLALALAIVAALIPPIVEWSTTRYQLGSDNLSFTSGLLFRKHRTISYGSIHAINSSSPAYLQPFGVVQLTVSAAGAADADIRLTAVPAVLQLELEQLRTRARTVQTSAAQTHTAQTHTTVTSPNRNATYDPAYTAGPIACVGKSAPSADSRGRTPVFRASVKDILLSAITDLGFLAAAFVVYGFIQQIQEIVPKSLVRRAEQSVGDALTGGVLSVVMLVLVCVMTLMVVSIVTSLLRFYGFEVWRRGDDLVVVRGLFTRRTSTIPISRIQTVIIRQSLLRRPFGLCSVGLGLSSSTGEGNEENAISAARILPVIGTRRVYTVLHDMLPEWDVREPDSAHGLTIRHTGRGLLRYYLTMPVISTLAAMALVWLGSNAAAATAWRTSLALPGLGWPWWLLFVPLACGLWLVACRWLKCREEGYAIADEHLRKVGQESPSAPVQQTLDASSSPETAPAPVRDIAVLPNRIVVSGASTLNTFMMVTRRSRVQSFKRSTTLWREPRGIFSVRMLLFVMNGISELRFLFLDRKDAETLARWFDGQ
ncbi:PH domain-containing protein [Bifidobacterium olomucense]|uniref:Bacterial PH domain-containing protein n=1 Tax=Bifidobacterium olomucense TaxID=2675324 RepID=A0A7Y0EXZ0_9BIFI|nr:PH domain-containing protein [Bifidobacterium sp. DSM 109959]NMM98466.1 Bacterial PH domain-containing protein [Bifidobacterium sp. DSM 109959]